MKIRIVPASELTTKTLMASDYLGVDRRTKRQRDYSLKKRYTLEALRWIAKKRCIKSNCGTVCLCAPCSARKALEYWNEPTSR